MKNLILILFFLSLSIANSIAQEYYMVKGIILETKSDYEEFLKNYPDDPPGAGSFSGPEVQICSQNRIYSDNEKRDRLMAKFKSKNGFTPYGVKFEVAGWRSSCDSYSDKSSRSNNDNCNLTNSRVANLIKSNWSKISKQANFEISTKKDFDIINYEINGSVLKAKVFSRGFWYDIHYFVELKLNSSCSSVTKINKVYK